MQVQLADNGGVSARSVTCWETGLRRSDREYPLKLAEVLECELAELLERKGAKRMGMFDKTAYNVEYNKAHTALYTWRMRKELRPKLDEYSRARGIPPAELLRQLVDADAIAHGLPPVFSDNGAAEPETGRK